MAEVDKAPRVPTEADITVGAVIVRDLVMHPDYVQKLWEEHNQSHPGEAPVAITMRNEAKRFNMKPDKAFMAGFLASSAIHERQEQQAVLEELVDGPSSDAPADVTPQLSAERRGGLARFGRVLVLGAFRRRP